MIANCWSLLSYCRCAAAVLCVGRRALEKVTLSSHHWEFKFKAFMEMPVCREKEVESSLQIAFGLPEIRATLCVTLCDNKDFRPGEFPLTWLAAFEWRVVCSKNSEIFHLSQKMCLCKQLVVLVRSSSPLSGLRVSSRRADLGHLRVHSHSSRRLMGTPVGMGRV